MDKLLIICGPTATGKTKLALELAHEFNGELVSADSRQIYRGMDIGTGKDIQGKSKKNSEKRSVVWKSEKYEVVPYDFDGVPGWMYDVIAPDEEFSVSHYHFLAGSVIEDIQKRNKLPILVGGTGLYIKSILEDLETIDIPQNTILRKTFAAMSLVELQRLLQSKSLLVWSSMNNSDRNNSRRLMRKLEVAASVREKITSGVSFDSPDVGKSRNKPDELSIGLRLNLEELQKKIQLRVQDRVRQGILKEIQTLLDDGYSWNLPSLNTFGYKEWKQYFERPSDLTKQKAIEEWVHDEIQYAKRQITWFKKQEAVEWFDMSEPDYQKKIREMVALWYN